MFLAYSPVANKLNLFCCCLIADKAHGKEFSQQFEDTCVKVEDYVVQLERTIKERTSLIEMLEQSELFYDAQYGEAKIVANVSGFFSSFICHVVLQLPIGRVLNKIQLYPKCQIRSIPYCSVHMLVTCIVIPSYDIESCKLLLVFLASGFQLPAQNCSI